MEPCCQMCGRSVTDCYAEHRGWVDGIVREAADADADACAQLPSWCWSCLRDAIGGVSVELSSTSDDPLLRALVHATLANSGAVGDPTEHAREAERLLAGSDQ